MSVLPDTRKVRKPTFRFSACTNYLLIISDCEIFCKVGVLSLLLLNYIFKIFNELYYIRIKSTNTRSQSFKNQVTAFLALTFKANSASHLSLSIYCPFNEQNIPGNIKILLKWLSRSSFQVFYLNSSFLINGILSWRKPLEHFFGVRFFTWPLA